MNPTRFRAQFREALYRPASSKDRGANGTPEGAPALKRQRTEDSLSNASSFTDSIASTITGLAASSSSTSLSSITSASGQKSLRPIHRPLLACLLAWGSKFSDHTLLVMDRRQIQSQSASASKEFTFSPSPADGSATPSMRSNVSRLLVDRAREVAEMEKCFRIAQPENVVVCLLMEPVQPLQSCKFVLPVHIPAYSLHFPTD